MRRRMALMFQRGALFTGMTVLENVTMPLIEHYPPATAGCAPRSRG
ncbi:MAG: hypothetical protein U5L11_13095 [Arhodomonas sp.]|nr:hypothetical protein [Arhodomonas sp.]